ncbi:MAG TPA: hypothetical protein VFV38_26580 [Ktedonobacteraceae bacterium]|nr:hypothetical protein [Ktedonobacteraceae bacterium]
MPVCSEKSSSTMLLVSLSRRIAKAIDAQPNHCAVNAWRTLIEFPEIFRDDGHLVEGWCVVEEKEHVALIEHVWCELGTGQIVDPSILLLVEESTPMFYFTGLTRDYAETEALEGEFFPHVRFDGLHGENGLGHAGYHAAWAAARRKIYARALARKPPKAMEFAVARGLKEPSPPESDEEILAPIIEGADMDLQLSLETNREIQAVPEQCWYNARQALLDMPNTFFTSMYVEGWCVGVWSNAIRVSEHGWITRRDGSIVDPSIVLGSVPKRLIYLPGLMLSWLDIQPYRTTRLPLAREVRKESPGYHEACKLAIGRAEELAWQTELPVLIEPGGARTLQFVEGMLHMTEAAWDVPISSPPPISPFSR